MAGYDEETVRSNQKGYLICKLLFVEDSSPVEISEKLDINDGTVRHHLREIRKLGFVSKSDEIQVGGSTQQLYTLELDGIVDFWLKSQLKHPAATPASFRLGNMSDEEFIEFYEKRKEFEEDDDQSTNYSPWLEIAAVKAGRKSCGTYQFLMNYFSSYFANINESTLDSMLFNDLKESCLTLYTLIHDEDYSFEPLRHVTNLYLNDMIFVPDNNPQKCLLTACLDHPDFDYTSLVQNIVDMSVEEQKEDEAMTSDLEDMFGPYSSD